MLYLIYEIPKRKNGKIKEIWGSRFETREQAQAWYDEKRLDYPGMDWDRIILSVGE